MSYLSIHRETLRKDLKNCVIEIIYCNDEMAHRQAIVTLLPFYIPEVDRGRIDMIVNEDHHEGVIKVWDVNNKAWRSIPLHHVISCQMKDGW